MKSCVRCGAYFDKTHHGGYDARGCLLCRNRSLWYDRVYSYGPYRDDLRAAIFLMKKPDGEALARTFAHLMYEYRAFYFRGLQIDALIPVPMHNYYRTIRGTNDSQVLAEELGKLLDVPVEEDLVKCAHLRLSQRAVLMEEREKNVHDIFAPKSAAPDRAKWRGKRAMIVDDVMTTGSTVNELARILKSEFGFYDVTVCVLARARGKIHPSALETIGQGDETPVFIPNIEQYKRGKKKPEKKKLKKYRRKNGTGGKAAYGKSRKNKKDGENE